MAWKIKTIRHPSIFNRDITLILKDGLVHMPSARFLIKEAREGGRKGQIGGRTTHLQRAKQLRELFYHLEEIGKSWDTAVEVHIEAIRNSMLHWDKNGNPLKSEINKKSYKKIKNDTMNTKLSVWFKFYKYMDQINEPHNIVLSIKKKRTYVPINSSLLGHLQMRYEPNTIEVWKLLVASSPKLKFYKSITRREFKSLCTKLAKKDVVFDLIVRLMGDTGLRVEAANNVSPRVFRSYFRYFHSGKSLESRVPLTYTAKGINEPVECNITLRLISEIQKKYLSSLYIRRLKKYKIYCKKKNIPYDNNIMWILADGRPVNYSDIYKSIRMTSEELGRVIRPISAHWLRHSFAVWKILEYKERNPGFKITVANASSEVMLLLQNELGHASLQTTLRYSWTVFQIEELERLELVREPSHSYDGVLMTYQLFRKDEHAQEIVREVAKNEFGSSFKEVMFNPLTYALKRGIAIDTK